MFLPVTKVVAQLSLLGHCQQSATRQAGTGLYVKKWQKREGNRFDLCAFSTLLVNARVTMLVNVKNPNASKAYTNASKVENPNFTSHPFLLYCRSWWQLPHLDAFYGSTFPITQVKWLSSLYITQSPFVSLTRCHWCHRCNNQPWSTTQWLFLQPTFTAHLFQQAWKWEDEAG